jgi:subtilase family serine protease
MPADTAFYFVAAYIAVVAIYVLYAVSLVRRRRAAERQAPPPP